MFADGHDEKIFEEVYKRLLEKDINPEQIEDFSSKFTEAIIKATKEVSISLLKDLKVSAPEMLKRHRKDVKNFEYRLNKLWKKPFDLFEMFLVMSHEAGETFNRELRPDAARNNDSVFEVLTRLHGRACQVGQEVLVLMKSGYASGAAARWRTLHEIAAVAFFIKKYGNEVAERYLLYEVIESYKAMINYQKYADKLGYEKYTEEEIEYQRALKKQLLEKYGKDFDSRNGWAAEIMGKKGPSISDIEEAAGLAHLRPFYKMTSYGIHANAKSIRFNMGYTAKDGDIIFAGATNKGMADPGHGAAISLLQVNTALLTTKPSLSVNIILNAMQLLVDEVGNAFLEVHRYAEA